MNFKEQINQDLEDTFFNIDEFGEEHMIDRKLKTIIIDNETLKERNKKEYDGILTADLLYYIKESDLDKEPIPESAQFFDGNIYTIVDVKSDSGIYEIILRAGIS